MQAGFGKVDQLGVALGWLHFVGMDPVEERTRRIGPVGVLIAERRAVVFRIPAFAGHDAGMTANTGVEVDHEPKLDGG